MARFIYRFELVDRSGEIPIRPGAEIVHVGVKQGRPCLWIEQDVEAIGARTLRWAILGTGQEIPRGYEHLGTFLLNDGEFVWHVFRLPSE